MVLGTHGARGAATAEAFASLARAIHPDLVLADLPADQPMCEAA